MVENDVADAGRAAVCRSGCLTRKTDLAHTGFPANRVTHQPTADENVPTPHKTAI